MNNSSFEEQLALHGKLVYSNIGVSMMPLLRQHRDLMVIEKRPAGRLKKYDAVLYKRGEKYILHRILKVTDTGYVICGDNCRKREYDMTDQNNTEAQRLLRSLGFAFRSDLNRSIPHSQYAGIPYP